MPEDLFETLAEVWSAVRDGRTERTSWNFEEGYIEFDIVGFDGRRAVVRVTAWNFMEGDPWDAEIFHDHLKRIASELAEKYGVSEERLLREGDKILDVEICFMVDEAVDKAAKEVLRANNFIVEEKEVKFPGITQNFLVWWTIRGTGDTEWVYMHARGYVEEERDLLELAFLGTILFELAGEIAMKARGELLRRLTERLEEVARKLR